MEARPGSSMPNKSKITKTKPDTPCLNVTNQLNIKTNADTKSDIGSDSMSNDIGESVTDTSQDPMGIYIHYN